MMFKQNLLDILNDLSYHKRSKQTLLVYYIKKRLNYSLSNYSEDMNNDYRFLIKQDAKKTLAIIAKDKKKNK